MGSETPGQRQDDIADDRAAGGSGRTGNDNRRRFLFLGGSCRDGLGGGEGLGGGRSSSSV